MVTVGNVFPDRLYYLMRSPPVRVLAAENLFCFGLGPPKRVPTTKKRY